MKMLGLNPMEQEVIDLTNNIVRNGLIYFPEFCKVVHKKFREDDEEIFRQNMFKVKTVQTIYIQIDAIKNINLMNILHTHPVGPMSQF